MSNLKYRADIDGLRAIAVLGVIVYHAFPAVLPGGFSGVDIFFVISGYLISGILYKGHLQGNFSFKEFYARRIRRLFPALITVLVLCLGYGWVILLPDEYQQLGKHVAAGTLFIQNIVFWQESGYFDTAANLKPLLHLWSLAVEEQFYIFFPPILLLIWKRKWPLAAMLGVLLIASMIGNLVMSYQNGVSDFFLTPYRAWEFLGGSLLAWWHYDKGHQQGEGEEAPKYREALSWIGVILLALGMGLIQKGAPYPGWRALLPVAGTLMIMEGGQAAWVNRKILSNPAVVWIGLISYPLYLFHWPALSFVHIVKGENPKLGYVITAVVVSFLLATITYYLIEKKIRHHKSRWTLPILVTLFILTGIAGRLVECKVIKSTKVPSEMVKIPNAINDKNMLQDWKWLPVGKAKVLFFRAGGDGLQTLVLGDSNAQQYAPRLLKLIGKNKGLERGVLYVSAGGTPPIVGTINDQVPGSRDMMPKFQEVIANDNRIDRVVIVAWWHGYFYYDSKFQLSNLSIGSKNGSSEAMKSLGTMIKSLSDHGKKVTVILSIPTGRLLDPKNIHSRSFHGLYPKETRQYSKAEFLKQNGAILSRIASTARENGAEVIDPMDYLCTNGVCISENEDGPIRYDPFHLRPGYVRDHVKYLDQTVAP